MDRKVKYWIDLSDYDLETAVAMVDTRRYLYVGFMCHQAVEKAFKALYTNVTSDTAPYTHSLSYLAKKGGFYEHFSEEQKEFIDQLEPLNIEARYPAHKERLLRSLTNDKCREIISNTEEILVWIKAKL